MLAIWSPLVCCLLFHLAASVDVSFSDTTFITGCPEGFTFLCATKHCYKLILKNLEWEKAREECLAHSGAYLTIVNDEKEYNDQVGLLKDSAKDLAAAGCGNIVWIAAQSADLNHCKPYVWKPDGRSQLQMCFSKWDSSEPSCFEGVEHCGGYYIDRNGYNWNDIGCEAKRCALCEIGPFA